MHLKNTFSFNCKKHTINCQQKNPFSSHFTEKNIILKYITSVISTFLSMLKCTSFSQGITCCHFNRNVWM